MKAYLGFLVLWRRSLELCPMARAELVTQHLIKILSIDKRFTVNALAQMGSDVARIGLQSAYLVLLARYLGPSWFGDFTVLITIARFLVPLGTMGLPMVMALRIAQDRTG